MEKSWNIVLGQNDDSDNRDLEFEHLLEHYVQVAIEGELTGGLAPWAPLAKAAT